MELLGRLKRAVKKLTFLLNLKRILTSSTWQLASMIRTRTRTLAIAGPNPWRRRVVSFNDRPGLRACVEVVVVDHCQSSPAYSEANYSYDGEEEDNGRRSYSSSGATSPHHPLRRTTSYPLEADVDKHAELFIENFYKHLLYEKQVSLNLRYCRPGSSSFTSSADDSIVSPLSSASSQLVSPT